MAYNIGFFIGNVLFFVFYYSLYYWWIRDSKERAKSCKTLSPKALSLIWAALALETQQIVILLFKITNNPTIFIPLCVSALLSAVSLVLFIVIKPFAATLYNIGTVVITFSVVAAAFVKPDNITWILVGLITAIAVRIIAAFYFTFSPTFEAFITQKQKSPPKNDIKTPTAKPAVLPTEEPTQKEQINEVDFLYCNRCGTPYGPEATECKKCGNRVRVFSPSLFKGKKILIALLIISLLANIGLLFCLIDYKSAATSYQYENKILKSKLSAYTYNVAMVTQTGDKYHTAYCSYIKGKPVLEIGVAPIEELVRLGYTPCSLCCPAGNPT